jgi:hypothetical protein
MTTCRTRIEQKFNTYRVEVDGKKLTDNEVLEILKTSTDNQRTGAVWKASKKSGNW